MLGHFDSFQPEILGNPPPSLDSWRNYVFAFGVVKVPEEAFILGKEAVGTWDHCRPGLVSAENWKKNSSKLKETFSFPQYPIFEEDSLDKPLHFCEEMSLATISGRTISPSQRVVRDTPHQTAVLDRLFVSGLHYLELVTQYGNGAYLALGFVQPKNYVSGEINGHVLYGDGIIEVNGADKFPYCSSLVENHLSILIDADHGRVWFFKKGENQGIAFNGIPKPFIFYIGLNGMQVTLQSEYLYLPSSLGNPLDTPTLKMASLLSYFPNLDSLTNLFQQTKEIGGLVFDKWQSWVLKRVKYYETYGDQFVPLQIEKEKINRFGDFEYGDRVALKGISYYVVGVFTNHLWVQKTDSKIAWYSADLDLKTLKVYARRGVQYKQEKQSQEPPDIFDGVDANDVRIIFEIMAGSRTLQDIVKALKTGGNQQAALDFLFSNPSLPDDDPPKASEEEKELEVNEAEDEKKFGFAREEQNHKENLSFEAVDREKFLTVFLDGNFSFSYLKVLRSIAESLAYDQNFGWNVPLFNLPVESVVIEARKHPLFRDVSPLAITALFVFLLHFNDLVQSILPGLSDSSGLNGLKSFFSALGDHRELVFLYVKKKYWKEAVSSTRGPTLYPKDRYSMPSSIPEIVVDRGKPVIANAESPKDSLYCQLMDGLLGLDDETLRQEYVHNLHAGQKRCFKVQLTNEKALDYGGPYREVIDSAIVEVQSTAHKMLIPCPNEAKASGINRDRWVFNPDFAGESRDDMLEFLGILLGISLRSELPVNLFLSQTFWRTIVDRPPDSNDLKQTHTSLFEMIHHLKGPLDEDSMPYWTTLDRSKEIRVNGFVTPVKPEEIEEYIEELLVFHVNETREAEELVREGLDRVLPVKALSLFTPQEGELLFTGEPDVDVDELMKHTIYRDIQESDPCVQYFWEVMKELRSQERVLFLRFVYGSSRLPPNQKWPMPFKICGVSKAQPDTTLPNSQMCFFSLLLPEYSSKEILRKKLLEAITMCQDIDTDE